MRIRELCDRRRTAGRTCGIRVAGAIPSTAQKRSARCALATPLVIPEWLYSMFDFKSFTNSMALKLLWHMAFYAFCLKTTGQ
jgi:hypothetical protein